MTSHLAASARTTCRLLALASPVVAYLVVATPATAEPPTPSLPANASETSVAFAWHAATVFATADRTPAARSNEVPSDWGAGNPPSSFDDSTTPTLPPGTAPSVRATPVRQHAAGFDGITELEQKLADGGHNAVGYAGASPSVCEGNGFVLETVQNAARIFSTDGDPLTRSVAMGPLLGDGPEELSRSPLEFGTFSHAHERCYFDPQVNRFMITAQRYGADGSAAVELAVSRTTDPRARWDVYTLPTTGDGSDGADAVPQCPCSPALLSIGADANGIYLATTLFGPSGTSAGFRVYAIGKRALAMRTATRAVAITEARPADPSTPYPVGPSPAQTPPRDSYAAGEGGTEYLVAACGPLRSAVFVLAITNTSSLAAHTPALSLTQSMVATESTLGEPVAVQQRDGRRPLADYVRRQWGPAPLEFVVDAERCSAAVWADGRLWVSQATAVTTGSQPATAGIAWFQFVPRVAEGTLSVNVANQGYLAAKGNSVITSSLAVDHTGHGAISMELVGKDYYPSAAFAPIDETGTGRITIVGRGQVPLDSFTGYEWFGSGDRTANADDFSTATVGTDGQIWTAVSYQPRIPRELLTSWSTRITAIDPTLGEPATVSRAAGRGSAVSPLPPAGPTVPYFTAHFDQNGRPYPYAYRMIGSNPASRPRSTTVPATIIPLRLEMPDGTIWDATTDSTRAAVSPLFRAAEFNSGHTQFGDALMRAQFWNTGGSTQRYHVLLASPRILPTADLTVPAGFGEVITNPNGTQAAVVDHDWMMKQIHLLIDARGVSPRTLPIALTHQVRTDREKGAHGWWDTTGGGRQTWVFAEWVDDPSPLPDAAILSHEVAEWFADPFTDNVVPNWQSPLPGPAANYGCQRLLETGDPLVGVNQFVDGYHLQDEAMLPWFTRQMPSRALDGDYTAFGTFTSPAPTCGS